MLPNSTLDSVQNLDIVTILSGYISLKRKGNNYSACCPLHNERTPSFSVNQQKGIFKCFGCGAKGDAISFVMQHEKINFTDAVLRIAKDHNIDVPKVEQNEAELEQYRKLEGIKIANELACKWFEQNLQLPENIKPLEYVRSRWNDDTIAQFRIGFAPDGWDNLKKWAASQGIRKEILLEAGLLSESKNKVFDYFRNRIIFPIPDSRGRISAFTGRDFSSSPDAPKYFNSHETIAYTKGEVLYGLNFAKRTAKEKGFIHLVEGNPDVIRLHQIGKLNTVGTCGTSLTPAQIESIKQICPSVTIIGDSDKAGKKAVDRSAELLINAGLFVNIVEMPTTCRISEYLIDKKVKDGKDIKDEKTDPDSFFNNENQFDLFVKANLKDYILWKVTEHIPKAQNPDLKSRIIGSFADLVSLLPASSHEVYIEQLGKLIKPKKAWQDALKSCNTEKAPAKEEGWKIPDNVLLSDFEKYGFYKDENCYYFKTAKGVVRGTNFVMVPLFHISSVLNAKRLYKITNEFGFSQVIELLQKDLIGLASFRLRVESLGNFLFEASETELNKLKRYLYEKTDSCFEITQLGWQKQGFWAWSNGIFSGAFSQSDANGIVKFQNDNFYLPASSTVYQLEDSLFVTERRFKFSDGSISLYDYTVKLTKVFGENAMFAISFYIATLFRDHIFKLFGFFPILNLFGPKGAGKTELAISMLQFFGNQSKGLNLTNTTRPALADHVGMFSNAFCHIDEYKNNVEYEKIEYLKGLWDGMGRTRKNMEMNKRNETSNVDCSVILSGQEMPTADIALFSRLIFLSFTKVEYSDQEKNDFNNLKEVEKTGLTHITHDLLSYRAEFIANFFENYQESSKLLGSKLNNVVIEDRIFRNWLIIIASYRTLMNRIRVPFSEKDLLTHAVILITRQNQETKKSNELSIFWSIVEFLANDGLIKEDVDFRIDCVDQLKTDTMDAKWSVAKNVIYINHSRLFQLYRVHGNKSRENILPLKTLEYYLQHSKEYLGRKLSVSFRVEDNGRIVEDIHQLNGDTIKKRKVTTAMVFEYDKLDINLSNNMVEPIEEKQKENVTDLLPR
jgi:DNA primase